MNRDTDFVREREDEAVNLAAVGATLAIEASIARNIRWMIPYEFEDRYSIEHEVKKILYHRLGREPIE
jgi:hypothetical protein